MVLERGKRVIMNQYLYRLQPERKDMLTSGPTEMESRIVSEHFSYLMKLTKAGTVFLAGRTLNTDPDSFGIVIFRAESETEARKIMENDPAVQGGVMIARLFPYGIALLGDPEGWCK